MSTTLTIDPDHLRGRHIERAVDVLRQGGVIIYPTDTIYGIGCDITSKSAIERVQRIKGRDSKKPMSFICSDLKDVSRYARVSNYAHRMLKQCLPGAYTFVLPAPRRTARLLTTRQKSVALRIPEHPEPLALVKALGEPILSTSANFSDQDVITEPWELEEKMGHLVDLILDCGSLPVQPSSVISLIDDHAVVLREGKGDISLFVDQ